MRAWPIIAVLDLWMRTVSSVSLRTDSNNNGYYMYAASVSRGDRPFFFFYIFPRAQNWVGMKIGQKKKKK